MPLVAKVPFLSIMLAQGLDLFSSYIHSDSESESDDIEQEIVDAGHIH